MRATQEILQEIRTETGCVPRQSVLACNETTFRIGGELEYLLQPDSEECLSSCIKILRKNHQPIFFMGAGSNLLINSAGIKGWVVRLGKGFRYFNRTSADTFRVGAAYPLMTLARELSQSGYSGLEFAAGIPASTGGAIRMNAGAHQSEVSSVLQYVEGLDAAGNTVRISVAELDFSYRHCSLPADFLITAGEFRLLPADAATIMQKLQDNLEYRKRTQPLSLPSAGSVFRNPAGNKSAGALLESLGMKGCQVGGAEISGLHANWIVNPSRKATSSDVLALIEKCRQEARNKRSIELQPEIVVW